MKKKPAHFRLLLRLHSSTPAVSPRLPADPPCRRERRAMPPDAARRHADARYPIVDAGAAMRVRYAQRLLSARAACVCCRQATVARQRCADGQCCSVRCAYARAYRGGARQRHARARTRHASKCRGMPRDACSVVRFAEDFPRACFFFFAIILDVASAPRSSAQTAARRSRQVKRCERRARRVRAVQAVRRAAS